MSEVTEESPSLSSASTQHRRRWAVGMLLVIVVAALALVAYAALDEDDAPPTSRDVAAEQPQDDQAPEPIQNEVIAEFSGVGDQTAGPFEVEEGWQIHWQNDGNQFRVAVVGADDGVAIDADEPGSGVASPTGSGSFEIRITADSSWRVWIIKPEQ